MSVSRISAIRYSTKSSTLRSTVVIRRAKTLSNVTTMRGVCRLGIKILIGFATAAALACGDGGVGPSGPVTEMPNSLPPLDSVGAAVREAFQRELGQLVPRPVFSRSLGGDCNGNDWLTTAVYLQTGSRNQRSLNVMHMTRDGMSVVRTPDGNSKYGNSTRNMFPAGIFRVLTVLITRGERFNEAAMPAWRRAQDEINEQHAAFARSRGYASPIVQFVFDNVRLDETESLILSTPSGLDVALAKKGRSTTGYDFVVTIDIASVSGGGSATWGNQAPYYVRVGNFGRFEAALTDEQMRAVAATAYHHEVGHHWGWQHDWVPSCGGSSLANAPFITDPALFGWEDTDGDGVPEILDTTPYGRSR